jgi:hypothetical protein
VVKLPWAPPPTDLEEVGIRADERLALGMDRELWRLHRTVGEHVLGWNAPRHYGPVPGGRFDPHHPPPRHQEAAVLYAAQTAQTCLAEVFQTRRAINRWRGSPYLTLFRPTRTLELLDLRGPWPTRAGASQAIASGRRDIARSWARSIRSAFPNVDGVAYASSMDGGGTAFALFERASDGLPARPDGSWPLSHPELGDALARAARTLGYRLL